MDKKIGNFIDKTRPNYWWLVVFYILIVFGALTSLGLRLLVVKMYEPEIVFTAKPFDGKLYDSARQVDVKRVVSTFPPSAMVVPSALADNSLLSAVFSSLNGDDYETAVLLSVSSSEEKDKIFSSAHSFITAYGSLNVDKDVFSPLARKGEIIPDDDAIGNNESILSYVSFLKKYWPDIKVLPLAVSSSFSDKKSKELASRLYDLSRSKRILLVLVDDLSLGDLSPQSKTIKQGRQGDWAARVANEYARLSGVDFYPLKDNDNRLLSTQKALGYFYSLPSEPKPLPKADDGKLDLLFVGDLMMDRDVKERIGTSGPAYFLSGLAKDGFFSGYDVVSANLEGAVTEDGEHYPPNNIYDFAFYPDDVASLGEYYFNYFTIANNHVGDQGKAGRQETADYLSSFGFLFSGCSDGAVDLCSLATSTVSGQKLSFLSFSMVYRALPEKALLASIKEAKEQSDLVIVNIHWGKEYEHLPAANQRALAKKMSAAGADLIIGHHPHVVSGLEKVGSSTIALYSLGNFIFDQYDKTDTQEELAVAVSFSGGGLSVKLIPIKSERMKLRLMDGKEKVSFLKKVSSWSFGDEGFLKSVEEGMIVSK
jgi:poly-gamma-glutamate synthesis protein (capsule biosynthesis protein)